METHYIELNERKTIFRRFLFTCFILVIFIIGNRIPLLSTPNNMNIDAVYKITVSNMGGNLDNISIFTLGLGPWLTAMIFISLYYYKFPDKVTRLTNFQRDKQEKVLLLIFALIQSYLVVKQAYLLNPKQHFSEVIAMLILIAGCMMLVWLADMNTVHGLGGPMPIVFISIIKSFVYQSHTLSNYSWQILSVAALCILIAFLVLIVLEVSEYRLEYENIMSVTEPFQKPFIAWKLNPSGSLAIMISMSLFLSLNYFYQLLLHVIFHVKSNHIQSINFNHPTGILIYLCILFILTYWLSVFMLNPKNKAEMFQKSGDYFLYVRPGKETEKFIYKKARLVSGFGAMVVTLIIGIPLLSTLLYPKISVEIYLAIQIIMVVYIALNMMEVVKTYLYFDRYKGFLKKYW